MVELNQNKSNIHKDSSKNILLLKLTLQFNKKWIAFCADSFFRGSVSRKCFENADASEKWQMEICHLKIRIYKIKESTKEKQMEDTVILCLLLSRIGKTDAVQACSTAIGGALYARMGMCVKLAVQQYSSTAV